MRDVAPGEGVVITARGELHVHQCTEPAGSEPCIFEYVYFARPASMIDNLSVHKARMRMGVTLGEQILTARPDHAIAMVIPLPDTPRDLARAPASVPAATGKDRLRGQGW